MRRWYEPYLHNFDDILLENNIHMSHFYPGKNLVYLIAMQLQICIG